MLTSKFVFFLLCFILIFFFLVIRYQDIIRTTRPNLKSILQTAPNRFIVSSSGQVLLNTPVLKSPSRIIPITFIPTTTAALSTTSMSAVSTVPTTAIRAPVMLSMKLPTTTATTAAKATSKAEKTITKIGSNEVAATGYISNSSSKVEVSSRTTTENLLQSKSKYVNKDNWSGWSSSSSSSTTVSQPLPIVQTSATAIIDDFIASLKLEEMQ